MANLIDQHHEALTRRIIDAVLATKPDPVTAEWQGAAMASLLQVTATVFMGTAGLPCSSTMRRQLSTAAMDAINSEFGRLVGKGRHN